GWTILALKLPLINMKLKKHPKTNKPIPELWEMIKNYNNDYAISNYGRIKSWKCKGNKPNKNYLEEEGKILKTAIEGHGYKTIGFFKKGIGKTFKIHRLVGEYFIPNPENKPELNHIDGIKTNNFYLNLEWCTAQENQIHAYKTGLQHLGEKHGRAKIKASDVKLIRKLYSTGDFYQYELANIFGLGQTQSGRIVRGETWKHLEKETPDIYRLHSGKYKTRN
ncbi:MAG TPA: NUMOD4 domain-containing protein, partial [Bacteroidales bacterium]|nr:NUMOD4 domain-containing protein [Bacteroidales bacterium]